MPYRGIFFEKNQPFHIVSRSVEGIKIFEDEEDCYRFIFFFQCANLGKRGFNLKGKDIIKAGQALLYGENIPQKFITVQHPPLVYLLDFSLVITHNHLYMVPNIENSVPPLIQKLNNSFAKYYNLKHGRKGALFGDRYKSILVGTRFQSDAVSRYVSLINPLDVFQPDWREQGLKNWEEAFKFLKSYQFSSFPDKIGLRRAKILASPEILERYSIFYKDKNEFQKYVEEFLKQKSSYSLFLE
jgi:hypothetical protein